jgi:regulator of sirC expression with transglutaminase-like and TPR domain
MAIAQRLNIPVKGVNLYNNFILAYVDPIAAKIAYPNKQDDVLFYINPFNRGSVFDYKEIDKYLEQQKIEKHKSNYLPISNIQTIQTLILELIKISKTTENNPRFIEQMRELYQISIDAGKKI